MKTAKTEPARVWADCPECGGQLIGEDGSMTIQLNKYKRNTAFKCNSCGESFPLDAKAKKYMG